MYFRSFTCEFPGVFTRKENGYDSDANMQKEEIVLI